MYKVERASIRAGRETVVVTWQGRRVGSASIGFVQWMHDNAPKNQLRPEQRAMVDWYGRDAVAI
jgi:hypothetical protein